MDRRRLLAWPHRSPTAAFVIAALWAATAVLWLVNRPDSGGSLVLAVCAGASAPVWTALGVQRLRAKRNVGDQ
ncbi:hypothetical protein L1I79_30015 [Strepomyces sp. STD 3.1]|uniref:hypothetical protein n=1 Tax=Streptomyces sp. NPDC058985 TaxID=3346684 RepID=UPI001F482CEA|nr:hypothetical protein [Streptomyces sp. STD 3.1]